MARETRMIGSAAIWSVGSLMRRQGRLAAVLVCCGTLLALGSCARQRAEERAGEVSEQIRMLEEQVLMVLFPKEEPMGPVAGKSHTWRLGDVQVAAWHPKAVTATSGAAYGRFRWSILAHAPATVTFPPIEVGEEACLRFGWYLLPEAYKEGTDGARFRIWCATEAAGEGVCIFDVECLPAGEQKDVPREEIPLPARSGESVRLSFETDPGPSGRNEADWSTWEAPAVRWYRKVGPKPNLGPNAILFTLDTLRADRLSCYGYHRETSPATDDLAARGTLMTRAYAQSTTTVPSHISIMTSMYLKEFGIYTQSENPLPSKYRTLAECLRDAGYATAGLVAAGFMKDAWTGLGQGFDTFVECPVGTLGEHIVDFAINWLVEHHSERYFMWIHLYDCHVPYHPPHPFKERFVDPGAAYASNLIPSLLPESPDEVTFERLSSDYYSDRYDGAVAYTDHQVGRVVSTLKDLGVLDNTLVVIAADHGECLGEHSIYFTHVSLYEPNVRVPLIFWWPGHVPEGKRFSELCENVDIYPTILDLLGVEARGRLSGESLLPVWQGQARGREGVVAEHSLHAAVSWRTKEWTYLYQPVANEAVRAALPKLWREGARGQWVLHAREEELYNRQEDRDELYDRSDSAGEVLELLRGDCAEWVDACERAWGHRQVESSSPTVGEIELIHQLRALGYL